MKKLTKAIAGFMTVAMVTATLGACAATTTGKAVASVDDLNGARVGVQLGTTGDIYVTDLEKEEGSSTTVERYKTGFEAVQSLLTKRIDAVVIDNEPAKAFVATNDDKLKILEEPFEDEEYAICFAKDNTELTEKVNKAIAELKADGTVQKILDNYIGDNTGSFQYTSPADAVKTNGTLKMATNAAFPPYENVVGDKVVGIDPDMALAIADKLGMALEIQNIDFDSVIPAVSSGKADMGMAGMTITDERKVNVSFSDTYCKAKQVIIVMK